MGAISKLASEYLNFNTVHTAVYLQLGSLEGRLDHKAKTGLADKFKVKAESAVPEYLDKLPAVNFVDKLTGDNPSVTMTVQVALKPEGEAAENQFTAECDVQVVLSAEFFSTGTQGTLTVKLTDEKFALLV